MQFETSQIFSHVQMDAITPNIVGPTMLRVAAPFASSLTHVKWMWIGRYSLPLVQIALEIKWGNFEGVQLSEKPYRLINTYASLAFP